MSALNYTKRYFAPAHVCRPAVADDGPGDSRRAPVYVYTDEIVLAINVAIATHRPLLVRGASGSGKSSLARNVAQFLGWRYYEKIVTSRTEARELLWEVDVVRRLHDARSDALALTADFAAYIVPGVLWWAFDRTSARWRGTDPAEQRVDPAPDPQRESEHPRAVVLLDEIDKADPDVPNNLLVPLGSLEFVVEETGSLVKATEETAPLIVLTTNEERELPTAFLRRCVEVRLGLPGRDRLLEIARAHFVDIEDGYLDRVATALFGPEPDDTSESESPLSPAEFLDTVRAGRDLDVGVGSATWDELGTVTAWKHGRAKPT